MRYMKQGVLAGIISVFTLFGTSVQAESYVGLGVGLAFDLAGLGATIANDGLDSNVGNPSMSGASRGAGCGGNVTCLQEVPGTNQELIIPENKLITLEKATAGAIRVKEAGGPMMGLVMSVFYESASGNTFWRVGIDHTEKVRGGHTESDVIGFKWYHMEIDYTSTFVPVYYGFKAKVGETAAVYIGGGINFHRGGFGIRGTNYGDAPTAVLGTAVGATTVTNAAGNIIAIPVVNEDTQFKVQGIGMNFVMGIEMGQGANKFFIELDQKIAGAQGIASTTSAGGQSGLRQIIAYPQNLSERTYRFGYKIGM